MLPSDPRGIVDGCAGRVSAGLPEPRRPSFLGRWPLTTMAGMPVGSYGGALAVMVGRMALVAKAVLSGKAIALCMGEVLRIGFAEATT